MVLASILKFALPPYSEFAKRMLRRSVYLGSITVEKKGSAGWQADLDTLELGELKEISYPRCNSRAERKMGK